MARFRKEPKPYALKQRRGERPYRYSDEYYAGRRGDPEAHDKWVRKFSPNQAFRAPGYRDRVPA